MQINSVGLYSASVFKNQREVEFGNGSPDVQDGECRERREVNRNRHRSIIPEVAATAATTQHEYDFVYERVVCTDLCDPPADIHSLLVQK